MTPTPVNAGLMRADFVSCILCPQELWRSVAAGKASRAGHMYSSAQMGSRRVVSPAGAKPSPNPLSPAVVGGDLVFVSGQTAGQAGGIEAQTRAVLEAVRAILEAAGSDLAHVLRCGVYLKQASDFAVMNTVYREFFPVAPPARATIICELVDPAVLVEIDCVAIPR